MIDQQFATSISDQVLRPFLHDVIIVLIDKAPHKIILGKKFPTCGISAVGSKTEDLKTKHAISKCHEN